MASFAKVLPWQALLQEAEAELSAEVEDEEEEEEEEEEAAGMTHAYLLGLLREMVSEEVRRQLEERDEALDAEELARQREAEALSRAQAGVRAAQAALDKARAEVVAAGGDALASPSLPPSQPALTLREQAKLRCVAEVGKYAIPLTGPEGKAKRAAAVASHRKPRHFVDTSGMGIIGRLVKR